MRLALLIMALVGFTSSLALAMPGDLLQDEAYYYTDENSEDYSPEEASEAYVPQRKSFSRGDGDSAPMSNRTVSKRSRRREDGPSSLDDVRIHAGVGLINSLQQIPVEGDNLYSLSVRGIEASLGIDLFSPNWIAEGAVLNFPEMKQDNYTVASNGFELKVFYTAPIVERVTLHGGTGLASRNFTIRGPGFQKSVAAANSVFALGANYWASGSLSIGLEGTARIPLNNANDPQSTDLAIRVDGHF